VKLKLKILVNLKDAAAEPKAELLGMAREVEI